jgi:hypothetical protein
MEVFSTHSLPGSDTWAWSKVCRLPLFAGACVLLLVKFLSPWNRLLLQGQHTQPLLAVSAGTNAVAVLTAQASAAAAVHYACCLHLQHYE